MDNMQKFKKISHGKICHFTSHNQNVHSLVVSTSHREVADSLLSCLSDSSTTSETPAIQLDLQTSYSIYWLGWPTTRGRELASILQKITGWLHKNVSFCLIKNKMYYVAKFPTFCQRYTHSQQSAPVGDRPFIVGLV